MSGKRKNVQHSMQGVFVFVLLGLFAVMSTLMVLLGAQMYRNTVDHATENNEGRVLGAYVRSMIRAEDAEGSVVVEDYDGVAQRPASHKSQRSNLNRVLFHHFAQLLGRNHVLQCIIQRLEIGVYLVLHVARQEAKLLASLYCGARQDDSPYLLILECSNGEGNTCIGFA